MAYYIQQRSSGKTFQIDRNQRQLVEYFGVARPSLARSFTEMIEEKTITRDEKILNINTLRSYISEI